MVAHVTLAGKGHEGQRLIQEGAVCAMKGQQRAYWPSDPFDDELRALLAEEARQDAHIYIP